MLEDFIRQLIAEIIRISVIEAVIERVRKLKSRMITHDRDARHERLHRLIHERYRRRLIHKYVTRSRKTDSRIPNFPPFSS